MRRSRLSRRERESLLHRDIIMQAALELFAERGFHNVSMAEIAQRSEFALGTLYKFFRSKEELYVAILLDKVEKLHKSLTEIISQDKDVVGIIEDYITTKVNLFVENAKIVKLYFAETRGIGAGLEKRLREKHNRFIRDFAGVLKRGIDAGRIRDTDPLYLAYAIDGLLYAFLFRWLESPDECSPESAILHIKNLLFCGVLERSR